MKKSGKDIWRGLQPTAAAALSTRDYRAPSLANRLAGGGVEAGQIVVANRRSLTAVWIPGVEIFARTVHVQRHRGLFGELARRDEGVLAKLKFWPKQWATARMFANTAKGFHVHPPFIAEGEDPAKSLPRRFSAKGNVSPDYEAEQWDVMFFVQGRVEMILRDLREGFRSRIMHFFIDGDNYRGPNNVAVVIPPGVAHALRVEGSEDAIMVYGTSTNFEPNFEGRIASDVESALLPESWRSFLAE
jgi:dTDP-4-dehydrorhamnose 3,5-epimerase-like enzyme